MLLATAANGQANVHDPIGAEELFRQGLTAQKAEDWSTACDKFRRSMELEPAVSTQFKLAKCSEHFGKLARAWYEFETARKLNADSRVSDRRRAELDAAIRVALSELSPRVPRMRIKIQPNVPGLQVFRDGAPVAASALGEMLPLDPGTHEVVVRAPGFEEFRRQVIVEEGRLLEVEVVLAIAKPPAPSPTPAPPSNAGTARTDAMPPRAAGSADSRGTPRKPQVHPSSPWSRRELGYALVSVGAVMFAAAGYFGVRTLMAVDEMKDYGPLKDGSYESGVSGPRDRALKAQTLGLVFVGIGAACSGVGVGIWLTAPSRSSTANPVGLARNDGYGFGVHGVF